jgi:aminomethyltransferase
MMGLRTPLYPVHVELGARIVDFGGWDMPLAYGSQLEEHHAVRRDAGMFDVSHMCVVDLHGASVRGFLSRLLANDVARLKVPGKALYSCMLREDGGIIDDLIVYFIEEGWFRLVVNAGTTDKDLAWIERHAGEFGVKVVPRRDLAMLAVQGPNARARVVSLLPDVYHERVMALAAFYAVACGELFVARTGYTGEDGFEVMLPAVQAPTFWLALKAAGVAPCGLGARDTLRLEAGMNLYGNDMDESVTPLESGLGWTVVLDEARSFIGKPALLAQKQAGALRRLVGLVLEERGVLRAHQKVIADTVGEGEVTSGSWSPTLERSIAFARVPAGTGEQVQVDIRGRLVPARVVRPPFVRNGQVVVGL